MIWIFLLVCCLIAFALPVMWAVQAARRCGECDSRPALHWTRRGWWRTIYLCDGCAKQARLSGERVWP